MRSRLNSWWRPEMEGECEYVPPRHVLDRLVRKGLARQIQVRADPNPGAPAPSARYTLTDAGYRVARGG